MELQLGKTKSMVNKRNIEQYREKLNHPLAERQFMNDLEAINSFDACVLVLPCGRSAHTEAGWFAGKGKKIIAYIPTKEEPELMYKLFDGILWQTVLGFSASQHH